MPFPLPDEGPPYTADLRWFLVAVPDDTAFVRAALGAYTEFTKYWVWGKEGKEAGRNEAAQVWEGAIAATLEALEMGFPDILLGYIDGVEGLLQQLILKDVCCGSEVPGGGLPLTDYSYADSDDVPANVIAAGYATGVDDATGMAAYKCMISHLYVQNVAAKLNEYAKYFDNAGDLTLSVAGVAAIAAALFIGAAITGFIALPLIGIEMLLGIGAAAGIFGALGELGESALQDAANELVANADDYVCAIYLEDGPAAGYDAFSALVAANMSAAMASLIDLIAGLQDLAALYTGRYADSDIAGELAAADYDPADFSCSCVVAEDTTLIAFCNLEGQNTPEGGSVLPIAWVNDSGPWLQTNTVYEKIGGKYSASTAWNYWVRIKNDQAGGTNPVAAPTSWRMRFRDATFPSSDYALQWMNVTSVISTVAYNVAQNDVWYTAPAGANTFVAQTAKTGTPLIDFEILEE